jgi:4-hydroxy 2-oxovalerate aldolase
MKILDCTLRDGGYYTNWDFDKKLVELYLKSMERLPIDYLEVGYRNPRMDGYYGEYFFCPVNTMEFLQKNSTKPLAIILNEKSIQKETVKDLLGPCVGIVSLVRLAVDPSNFTRALSLAEAVKALGFDVAFNVMYMSNWKEHPQLINSLQYLDGLAKYFYMVDSYGGVYPNDVKGTIEMVREKTNVDLGFHGHNNLELGLINTLSAIENKVDIVDATITGMGRGAGNLKMELLLTVLSQQGKLDIDFNSLSEVTDAFETLQRQYGWGTSLPYMVSGANSLPQKDVMEWTAKRYYSINSIVRALNNQKDGKQDNKQYPDFSPKKKKKALIVGGGNSVLTHQSAIKEFIELHRQDICIIHSSSRNAAVLRDVDASQVFCLVGNEGLRLEKTITDFNIQEGLCVLPPFPRKMGTYVPKVVESVTYELPNISFINILQNTHTALALEATLAMEADEVYVVGYDGYTGINVSSKEIELLAENEQLFGSFKSNTKSTIVALTPTIYNELKKDTVYNYI